MPENTLFTPSNILSGADTAVYGDITPLSEKRSGGLIFTDFYFPAGTQGDDQSISAYGMLCRPEDAEPLPLVMVIGNSRQSVDKQLLAFIAKRGYAVFMYDYLGWSADAAKFTFYPPEISYANYELSGRKLMYVDTNARETTPYQWLLLSARALSRALTLPGVLQGSTGVLGIGLGANTAWMLAALDSRVNALCTLFSAGWFEYIDTFKFSGGGDVPEIDEERERWIAGLSVQAYVKYIKCPVLYMSGSNSRFTDMDRAYDTLMRLPHKDVFCYIAPGKSRTLGCEGGSNISLFFDRFLKEKSIELNSYKDLSVVVERSEVTEQPEKSNEQDSQIVLPKTMIRVSGLDDSVKDFSVYYSVGQENPGTRYFYNPKPPLIEHNSVDIAIDVPAGKLLVCYVVVQYKSGAVLSARPAVLPPEEDIDSDSVVRRNPVIYNAAMGTGGFYRFFPQLPLYRQILIDNCGDISIMPGPGDINGLLCSRGGIGTYKINVESFSGEGEESLKFDIYSRERQTLFVYCLDRAGYTDEHWHYAAVELLGGEMWQPVEIKKQSLKTKDGFILKDWLDAGYLGFYCEGELLINNILWF